MIGFRIGDRDVIIDGVETRLRLTVSALAEIAVGLEAQSPKALANRLRKMSVADWNVVVKALAKPVPKTDLSKTKLTEIMPALSAVIADGLSP